MVTSLIGRNPFHPAALCALVAARARQVQITLLGRAPSHPSTAAAAQRRAAPVAMKSETFLLLLGALVLGLVVSRDLEAHPALGPSSGTAGAAPVAKGAVFLPL